MASERLDENERIGNATWGELKHWINQLINHRIGEHWYVRKGDRPIGEVLKAMRKNVWTPPPGAMSSQELLREDRDR